MYSYELFSFHLFTSLTIQTISNTTETTGSTRKASAQGPAWAYAIRPTGTDSAATKKNTSKKANIESLIQHPGSLRELVGFLRHSSERQAHPPPPVHHSKSGKGTSHNSSTVPWASRRIRRKCLDQISQSGFRFSSSHLPHLDSKEGSEHTRTQNPSVPVPVFFLYFAHFRPGRVCKGFMGEVLGGAVPPVSAQNSQSLDLQGVALLFLTSHLHLSINRGGIAYRWVQYS